MDLNPEAVKQEIEAVKVACDEVDARLRGRPNPRARSGILSRVSKVSGQPSDVSGHPSGPHGHQSNGRDNSRRFVNRDWNMARKRTAQGLFADDQAEGDAGADAPLNHEDMDRNGYHPRKRMQRDVSNYRSEQGYPADTSNSMRSRITFQGRDGPGGRRAGEQQQYDPFDAHGQHAGHPKRQRENHQHDDRDEDEPGQDYDGRPAGPPLRPYNRDSHLPRNGRNGHMHDMQHSIPARRDRDRSGGLQGATRDHGAKGDGGAGPAHAPKHNFEPVEEGELSEEMPGPPGDFGHPAVPFVAEKRPEPKLILTAADRGRNKRMLGALMGHLHKAEKQERTFEMSEVVQRRKELADHAEQRAREEAYKARAAQRERAHEARRQDVAQKRELLLQHNMKQAKLLCAQKIHHARDLLKFIRTQTVPPLLWKPARQNPDVLNIYQQQGQDFEMWADKQASKLQAEQQNMRERANKQWAEIDRMHEERMQNRRHGPPHGPRGRDMDRDWDRSGGGGRDWDRGGGGGEDRRDMVAGRRRAGGPPQLTTAQQAMLDREMREKEGKDGGGGGGGGRPVQLSTAQLAMLNKEKQRREAEEAAAAAKVGADEPMDEQQQDEEVPVDALEDADAEEEERRQAEEDDAEALDEGYLLDDVALQEEAVATDDDGTGPDGPDATAAGADEDEHAERFESEAHEHEHANEEEGLQDAGDEDMMAGEVDLEHGP